jgi:prolyl-tRNA synthetase
VRWSDYFIPTMKETPQDAEIISHQLMLRAGLIRKLSSGLYSYLPLGLRSLRKVEQIIREEMNRAGALEVLMPAMQPRDLWERSGRYEKMTDVMFNLKDKNKRDMVLGPTHEEVITEIAGRDIHSYRQLPINFYQIQTKFRDEIRPRFGLMRAREFIMKDAYSFDVSWEAADGSYQAMYDAYERIFKRCGLTVMAVEADSGAIGGSQSHEFMVLAEAGEDGIVICEESGYAANLERAEARIPQRNDPADSMAAEEVETPGMGTIKAVSKFLEQDPERFIKTLIYLADGQAVAVLLPGDRDVNEVKLAKVLACTQLEMAGAEKVEEVTGAPPGFAGPVGLSIDVVADLRLKDIQGAITGANVRDRHLKHVHLERDATVKSFADFCLVRSGDPCPRSGHPMIEKRGVEVGHVFKLGSVYSEALNATFVDEAGDPHPMVMGCYGIGVGRTMQAAIEQCHDKDGIRWPISIAPFHVEIVTLDTTDEACMEVVNNLFSGLEAKGVEVIIDDRDERPGFKFKDADLVGIPLRVTIGNKGLAKGQIELKVRGGDMVFVPLDEALDTVVAKVSELQEAIGVEC